jgi:S-DNA-T family DNA segregation ATPase FtsK/SpoIIIE
VASRTDSRVVLDEMGAEKLLGNGDLLFLWPGTSTLIRGQGTYLSDDEISEVIAAVATTEPQFVKELVQLKTDDPENEGPQLSDRDDLYEAAVDVVVREGRGSVSLLQRSLGIGYGRAARLIDYMAEDGIVGPYNGSQAREVTLSIEDWEAMQGKGTAGPRKSTAAAESATPAVPLKEPPPPKPTSKPRRSNKILLAPPTNERFDEEDEPFEEDVAPEDELEEDEEYGEELDDLDADDYPDEDEGDYEEEEDDWDDDESDEEEDDEWEEYDEEEDYEEEGEEDEEEDAPWAAESA